MSDSEKCIELAWTNTVDHIGEVLHCEDTYLKIWLQACEEEEHVLVNSCHR